MSVSLWRAAYRHSLKLRGVPLYRIYLIEMGERMEHWYIPIVAMFVVAASIYAVSQVLH